jgi:hypothetical protein
MTNKTIYDTILISYCRSGSVLGDYEFIKNNSETIGGGLRSQIVMVQRKISLGNLMRDFCGLYGFTFSALSTESALVIAAVIAVSLNIASLKVFSDSCHPIIQMLKSTPRGTTIDNQSVGKLLAEHPEIEDVLEALTDEKFLAKKSNGEYVVKHKILMHLNCEFI